MSFVVPGVLATDVRRFAVREQVGRFGHRARSVPGPQLRPHNYGTADLARMAWLADTSR